MVIPTIGINVAFNADAGDERVSLQAGRANAARLVVLDTALSSAAARLGGGCAWVDAVFLLAGLVKRTIVVNATFS